MVNGKWPACSAMRNIAGRLMTRSSVAYPDCKKREAKSARCWARLRGHGDGGLVMMVASHGSRNKKKRRVAGVFELYLRLPMPGRHIIFINARSTVIHRRQEASSVAEATMEDKVADKLAAAQASIIIFSIRLKFCISKLQPQCVS